MTRYALESVVVQATAPGVPFVAFPAVPGSTLTVRDSGKASLLDIVNMRQGISANNALRITSPVMHDAVTGIETRFNIGISTTKMPTKAPLQSQDTLVVTGGGSAAAGDIEMSSMLILYEDLAGIDANLITWKTLMERAEALYSFDLALVPGIAGGFSGASLINATRDQLKANREYAIVNTNGALNNTIFLGVSFRSPDWGNLEICIPTMGGFIAPYLRTLGFYHPDSPMIPVFQASQKSSVFCSAVANENAVPFTVTIETVLLKPAIRGGQRR